VIEAECGSRFAAESSSKMAALDPDSSLDNFRDDLLAYLAKRLGVPREIALSTLGEWLLHYERTHVLIDGRAATGSPGSGERR
jgi:hypothetical protein